jgi:hypothetical protein
MITAHLERPSLGLALALGVALTLRLAAMVALAHPPQSDELAYLAMAGTLANGSEMRDNAGLAAFYSAGYPILLALAFALFGATLPVAFAANLLLAGMATALVHRIALAITGRPLAAALAALGYAIWIPGIFTATMIFKENLSTVLMLGFVWATIGIDGERAGWPALAAGGLYGASLMAGTSALPAIAGFLWLIWARRTRLAIALPAFAGGAALILAPWLLHTARVTGTPVIATNSGFNLYLGNNPAATGRFVSIADTPAGPRWHAMLETLGERGATDALADEATDWIAANPGRAAALALRKLGWFWGPNLPDAADRAAAPGIATARWIDVAQHLLILGLAGWGFAQMRHDPRVQAIAFAIAGFWLLHAAAYIITRYREPVMPLLIVLAAIPVAGLVERRCAKT